MVSKAFTGRLNKMVLIENFRDFREIWPVYHRYLKDHIIQNSATKRKLHRLYRWPIKI